MSWFFKILLLVNEEKKRFSFLQQLGLIFRIIFFIYGRSSYELSSFG